MTRRGEPTSARMRHIQKRLDRYCDREQWAEAERYLCLRDAARLKRKLVDSELARAHLAA